MAIHNLMPGQVSRPAKQALKTARFPAPLKGVDARVALTEASAVNAVYSYNMTPFEYGVAVRKGYREHQVGVDLGESEGIHTIIPFDGIESQGAQDRLFAVTNEGIWDVTVAGAAPILKEEFIDKQLEAGYGVYTHYVGNDEADVLFYADSINGLFEYDAQTDEWGLATEITGPVIANINWIVSHKQRLWMIEENSTKAWYLEVGAKKGLATEFFFGSKFTHGGHLAGLFSWSVDGGGGLDDLFVAVSRAGDVLPYKGADPEIVPGEDNAWEVIGTYFIGKIPVGPYFGTEHGGELFLLSEYGIVSMNDLLQGVDSAALSAVGGGNAVAGPIAGLVRRRMDQTINSHGWQVQVAPSAGGIVINSPRILTGPHIQYYYNFSTRAWGFWRGVPMTAFDQYDGALVFGDVDNRILRMDVTVDNFLLDPPPETVNGVPIDFSLLTAFQGIDTDALYKRVQLIRPDFNAQAPPSFTAVARFDYDITEAIDVADTPIPDGDVWDDGLWDLAIWGTTGDNPYSEIRGSWGYGRYIAIALRGSSRAETRLIGFDVLYDVGGPLI